MVENSGEVPVLNLKKIGPEFIDQLDPRYRGLFYFGESPYASAEDWQKFVDSEAIFYVANTSPITTALHVVDKGLANQIAAEKSPIWKRTKVAGLLFSKVFGPEVMPLDPDAKSKQSLKQQVSGTLNDRNRAEEAHRLVAEAQNRLLGAIVDEGTYDFGEIVSRFNSEIILEFLFGVKPGEEEFDELRNVAKLIEGYLDLPEHILRKVVSLLIYSIRHKTDLVNRLNNVVFKGRTVEEVIDDGSIAGIFLQYHLSESYKKDAVTDEKGELDEFFQQIAKENVADVLEANPAAQKAIDANLPFIVTAAQSTTALALQLLMDRMIEQKNTGSEHFKQLVACVSQLKDPNLDKANRKELLNYIKAFFYETLRIKMVTPTANRLSTVPVTLVETSEGGYAFLDDEKLADSSESSPIFILEEGSNVTLDVWGANMHPRNYIEPDVFNPYRYYDDKGEYKDRLALGTLAFGNGPNYCPGRNKATDAAIAFVMAIAEQLEKREVHADPILLKRVPGAANVKMNEFLVEFGPTRDAQEA